MLTMWNSVAPDSRVIRLSGHLLMHGGVVVAISVLGSICETERVHATLLFRIKAARTLSKSHLLDTLRSCRKIFDDGTQGFRDEFIATITCGLGDTEDNPPMLSAAIFDYAQPSDFLALRVLLGALYAYLGGRTVWLALWPSAKLLYFVCLNWIAMLLTSFFISTVMYRTWPNFSVQQRMSERLHAVEFRRLARLSCGRLALVPKASVDGDVVALCRGGDVPLLLRRSGEYFEIVGECYVHAAMDGSLFEYNDCRVISLV